MGTKPCDACGERAMRFTKYAICGSCLDRAVELFVLQRKEFNKTCKEILNAIYKKEEE
jgi:hypothetical protein